MKAQIVSNASLGKGSGTLPGADPAVVLQIKDAVLGGVVQGLTDAMLIGAVACAIGAVLALTLKRPAEDVETEMPAMAMDAEHEHIAEPALRLIRCSAGPAINPLAPRLRTDFQER